MKYSKIIILIFLVSCTSIEYNSKKTDAYTSKGFAYIYNEKDFENKTIKKRLNNNNLEIAHNKLRPGALIKIVNLKTNQEIIMKNTKRFEYPDFYKILITDQVAKKLKLDLDLPLVEVYEVKKNKSFVAKKQKFIKKRKKYIIMHQLRQLRSIIYLRILIRKIKIQKRSFT